MTTPRTHTVIAGLMVSTVLASLLALSPADARPRVGDVRAAHVANGSDALRDRMLALVNRSRLHRLLPVLRIDERVSREALAHSRNMSRAGTISHTPDLVTIIVRAGGTVFGEDVGSGSGLHAIRDVWLRQTDTRRILLDGRFRDAGLGVVHTGGTYWVTLQAFN